jgi:hypothetical protein
MFKTELDKETGKYKIFNKKKGEYSKRMFSTKESANKMVDLYTNFSTRKRETDILKRGKEVKAAKAAGVSLKDPTKKPRIIRKKAKQTEELKVEQ